MEAIDSFGEWLKRQRTALGLTRAELAECAGCSVSALRKIEADERRPSHQLAGLLAGCLRIAPEERSLFIEAARGNRRVSRLGLPGLPLRVADPLANAGQLAVNTRPSQPVWNLPAPATPTIGREAELDILVDLLSNPVCRLLTLVGPGGIGKTRLATEAACHEWDRFAGGVYFASLAAIRSPDFMVPAIAEAVGLNLSSATDPREQLISHLRNARVLLLLDNLEHLLDGMELVGELLAAAPGLKILATSRERLGLRGEWLFEVQGLAVPADAQVESPEIYGAVQLFDQRARQVRLDFELSAQELPHVIRICRLVEGMPLAIELAATWLPTLTTQEIAGEIERGLDILAAQLRDIPERHCCMDTVFDHSWQLLTGEGQGALRQLAVFRGGFNREAAQTIAGVNLAMLSSLVSKSLIRRTATGRYDFHPIVHQFALSRLSGDPHLENAVRNRHSEFYLSSLCRQEQALKSAAQQETIQQLTEDIDNVRAAWTRGVEQKKFALLGPALRCFGLLFDIRGWSREGIEWMEQLLQALRARPATKERQKVLGQALAQQGLFFFRLGAHRQAYAYFEESLALLRPFAEPGLLVDPLVLGGIIMHLTGEVDRSHALLAEGLANARASGDRWFAAYALYNQGYIAGLSGRLDEGYQQMADGIALWRALGDPRFIALGLNFISPLAIRLGRLEEAQAFLEESLALSTEIGDRWGRGTAYRYLGAAALARGETTEAQKLLNHSLDIFKDFVTGWDVVMSQLYLGRAKAAAGDLPGARECYLESLQLAMEAGAIPPVLDALVGLAQLDLDAGEAQRGLELSLFVGNHPAGTHETLERAGLLQAQAEQMLCPEVVATVQRQAGTKSLASIVEQTVRPA